MDPTLGRPSPEADDKAPEGDIAFAQDDKIKADMTPARRQGYWRANLKLVAGLLTIWFLVSYGAGILFVEQLNAFKLPGTAFPLGFWFAQQGAIFTFVVLIIVYAVAMNRIDKHFAVDE